MKILVDADACPVVDLTVREANNRQIPIILITDTSHVLNRTDAEIITVEKGSDSADFKLVNLVEKNDLGNGTGKGRTSTQSKRDDLFRAEHGHPAVYPPCRQKSTDGRRSNERSS